MKPPDEIGAGGFLLTKEGGDGVTEDRNEGVVMQKGLMLKIFFSA